VGLILTTIRSCHQPRAYLLVSLRACARSEGVTYKYGLSPKLAVSSVMCIQSPRSTDRPRKWRHHHFSFTAHMCAIPGLTEYWQTGCDKRKILWLLINQTAPPLRRCPFCLACKPHLTRVRYRTLIQANNQHFSPVLSTIYPTRWYQGTPSSSGQNKGPKTV
jgi:hypothetical protein